MNPPADPRFDDSMTTTARFRLGLSGRLQILLTGHATVRFVTTFTICERGSMKPRPGEFAIQTARTGHAELSSSWPLAGAFRRLFPKNRGGFATFESPPAHVPEPEEPSR